MKKVALAFVAATALTALTAGVARADEPRLVEARRHHQALDYEQCLESLKKPASVIASAEERADAEILEGVCNFELGRSAIATDHFKRGLRLNPRALLPPYSSPKMVDAFQSASAAVRAEAPAPPPAAPPMTAPAPASASPAATSAPPTGEHEPPRRGVPIATLLLGAGAVVAGGVGTVAYVNARASESDANRARFESDAYALGDRARSSMTVANVALGGALVLAGAAVVVWIASER